MPTPQELEKELWEGLESDRTVMLGLAGENHLKPMTAQVEEGRLWFFTARDTELVGTLGDSAEAVVAYAAKGHGLFATIHGTLTLDNDPKAIDRLWNPFVAAWFEGGKSDPNLALLRFDPDEAEIWENDNSIFAGIKTMLGVDPKKDYRDKVARVRL